MRIGWFMLLVSISVIALAETPQKPLMKDFIGLNVHTVLFKPELYRPAISQVRDYHPIHWDLGEQTARLPDWPMAKNGVNWQDLYGNWVAQGYTVHACLMESGLEPASWNNMEVDLHQYGRSFAARFGSAGLKLVSSAEVFNEPTRYDDQTYRKAFAALARGLRAGDRSMRIATCNVQASPSGEFHKSIDLFKDLVDQFDILSTHVYAQKELWPTWRRSYPEDPTITYLKDVQQVIDWRNQHAPGKAVWVTEFGWDASSKTPDPAGPDAKWVGVSDLQQAQYLVRSLVVFASMDLEKAFVYFFNDDDKPSLHAAAGLTRNYQPKPSFYAIAQMQRLLGTCRFVRLVKPRPEVWLAQFDDDQQPGRQVWVVWRPDNRDTTVEFRLPLDHAVVEGAEPMATTAQMPATLPSGSEAVTVSASPLYVVVRSTR